MEPILLVLFLNVSVGLLIGLWPLTKGIHADQLGRGISGFVASAVPALLLTPIASLLIAWWFAWRIKKRAEISASRGAPSGRRRRRFFDFARRPMVSGLVLGVLLTVLLIFGYAVLLVPIAILFGSGGGEGTVVMHYALYLWIVFGAPWAGISSESGNGSELVSFFGGQVLNGALAGLIYGTVYGLVKRRGSA